jgi:hypothetical protein
MDEFIRAQVKSVLRTQNVPLPRPAGCLIVKKLAPRSVAAHLGVAGKDLLAFVDGTPAGRLDPDLYNRPAEQRTYTFYSRPRHEMVEAVVTGIEVGALLAPTLDALKARFDPGKADYRSLEALWEARDWATLEALATRCLQADKAYRRTPAFLFLGAALHEQKRWAEAVPVVDEYLRDTASSWTMNFAGIALLYTGLERLRLNDKARGVAALQSAWGQYQHARIADALQAGTGSRPTEDPPRWVGKVFPVDYALPRLEAGPGTVALTEAASRLQPGQLLGVCLLASYRGNGPYNDLMARYRNYATYFGRYLAGFHVLTMQRERPADRSWYFENEDQVRASGLPLDVLLDADGKVTLAVEPGCSPFVLLVDRDRRVACEGELDSVQLWNTLAAANGR